MTRLANPLSKLFKSVVNPNKSTDLHAEFEALTARSLAQRSDVDSLEAKLHGVSEACRTLLADRWARTQAADAVRKGSRRVHYLSMEFLMGRALTNALAALDLSDQVSHEFGAIVEREPDAALGNGGLGRLAACFLDSFATLGLPSFGYGLRYQHGMFAQRIQGGRQTEVPDAWLKDGNPWEAFRPELQYEVGFGGAVSGHTQSRCWVPAERLIARAYDFVVPGHGTERVSTLRQWQATAAEPIDYLAFSRGEHAMAGQHVQRAEALNWVLYPDDSTPAGRELRLKQEFFLVSASLQDLIARHLREGQNVDSLGRFNAVHLNDTHPALSVAELMRLLLDEHGLSWDGAWRITREATSYTNHTLMPEALETWPVRLLEALLPRHLEIIYEINQRFLDEVRAKFPNDNVRVQRLSLIDELGERRVRMANLAIVASSKVNGVSALHSDLMVKTIFADFAAMWPERFINVTNGVTSRRWLMQANPALSSLIDRTIGRDWRSDLNALRALSAKANDQSLGADFLAVKCENKQRLADHIRRELGIVVNVNSLFDVQIKRIHEYKRQLLNVLHVIARYQAIIANPNADWTPRTVIFSGKAASAYVVAKQIIQLIHDVGRVVNSDSRVGDRLKVVFLPNYSVSLAEMILPAADLSEQISTAGTEASGTGNMKFALNGALTVGTWDGANIEMAEQIGVENIFVFGLRTEAVAQLKAIGYDPRLYVEENSQLKAVVDAIAEGAFSWDEPDRYRGIVQSITQRDPYLLMADFADYLRAQGEVDALYNTPAAWASCAIRNVAGMGFFSVDRTINEYVEKVWCAPS
jgi:glycogen phosphorylase